MRVIAVIPAWNARDRLTDVLEALTGQVSSVVVVDNGSRDGTASWLADCWPSVHTIANHRNEGYPVAVNQGVAWALADGADAVLLVNDDAVFRPGAVQCLAQAVNADEGLGAVTPLMLYRDRPGVINGTGGFFDPHRGRAALRGAGEPDLGQYDRQPDVDYPSGAAALLRREALHTVGELDEAFYLYFEDTDWGLRARHAGWRTEFVPGARVAHVGSASTADDPARRRYYNVRNRLYLARRHASWRGRAWTWLATLALLSKQPARWLFSWRRRDAEAVMWAVADYVGGRCGRSDRYG